MLTSLQCFYFSLVRATLEKGIFLAGVKNIGVHPKAHFSLEDYTVIELDAAFPQRNHKKLH